MLKNPLPISFVGRPSTDRVSLNNVLVVHKMPVPFHLSTKGDNRYIIGVGREAFNISHEYIYFYALPLKGFASFRDGASTCCRQYIKSDFLHF